MYQALMTRRYLTSRVMPWLAVIAVMLCTAMVLTVWSIMSGFLALLLSSGRAMSGDVTIARPVQGIAHYADLVERLEAEAGIDAAAPTIETLALLGLPYDQHRRVQLIGIEPDSFDAVTGYRTDLWWQRPDLTWSLTFGDAQPLVVRGFVTDIDTPGPVTSVKAVIDPPAPVPLPLTVFLVCDDRVIATVDMPGSLGEAATIDQRESVTQIVLEATDLQGVDRAGRWSVELNCPDLRYSLTDAVEQAGRELSWDLGVPEPRGALVMGVRVWPFNRWARLGERSGYIEPDLRLLMPGREAEIMVPALSSRGSLIEAGTRRLIIGNEFRSGLVFTDREWVLMPLDILQRMLRLEAAEIAGPPVVTRDENGRVVVTTGTGRVAPARVTHVVVRGRAGADPRETERLCRSVYRDFAAAHDDVPALEQVTMYTWDKRPGIATFIAAVRKEISLVLFLFSLVSLTPAFLVFTIFWSMVSEKTKDIGVLRAIGAGRRGVGWLFLRYGMAIGVSGSVLGVLLAYVIVLNFNAIHAWLGEQMGVVVWDPAVYAFERLPSDIAPLHAALVFVGGILLCALGALVPAARAAAMDPVRAIRFE
ncbi:MAG: ABC transporter permease [Phycisphaerales bacterium]|nr:ABC transporter permease [Phycisphaerales bacterium]